MPNSVNKIIDKYQYNDQTIKNDQQAQIITAKHTILKEYFTLKKISVVDPKSEPKYKALLNQMSILKQLNGNIYFTKCHKMLKTSNNLYVVYDLQGQLPTLQEVINSNQLNHIESCKKLSIELIKALKELKIRNIVHVDLSPSQIEIDKSMKIKILQLEHAINLEKSLNSEIAKTITVTDYVAPEIIDLKRRCGKMNNADLQPEFLKEGIYKADIYCVGKILETLFSITSGQGKGLFQQEKSVESEKISSVIKKMIRDDPQERPNFEEIEILFSQRLLERRGAPGISKIKIPTQDLSKSNPGEKMTYSPGIKATRHLLSPSQNLGDDQDDRKSSVTIKSSGQFGSKKNLINSRKQSQDNGSLELDDFSNLSLKIMQRRNLCKFLLKSAITINSIEMIEPIQKLFLSYLLVKKSALFTCSLAKFLSTGRSFSNYLNISDTTLKQFSKTKDFIQISYCVGKQMDQARKIQSIFGNKLKELLKENNEVLKFDYESELKAEVVSVTLVKKFIRDILGELVKKIKNKHRKQLGRLKSRATYQQEDDFLGTSTPISLKNLSRNTLTVEDNFLVKTAKSLKDNSSVSSVSVALSDSDLTNQITQKIIDKKRMVTLYMLAGILKSESLEKVYDNIATKDGEPLEKQPNFKDIEETELSELVIKLSARIN